MTINLTTGANTIKIAPERYDGTEYELQLRNLQTNVVSTCICNVTVSGSYLTFVLTVKATETTTDNEIQLTATGEYIYTLTGTESETVCKVGRLIFGATAATKPTYEKESNTKIVYDGQ